MVIVRLVGGLGNQLFQYAFARSINIGKGVDVMLDAVSGFASDAFYRRSYSLGHYDIALPPASRQELDCALGPDCGRPCGGRETRGRYTAVREKSFSLNDLGMLDFSENLYFIGYWQTEKYFKFIEPVLRKELRVVRPLEGRNLEFAERIGAANSVSIHFRALHGVSHDGKESAAGIDFHGRTPLEYYREAVALISDTVRGDIVFVVFSDDAAFAGRVMEGLNVPCCIVSHNGHEQGHEDLRLMALCRHHIICNSTFSWWGAWLGNGPDKIVIAPRKWFNNSDLDTSDLMPDTWITI